MNAGPRLKSTKNINKSNWSSMCGSGIKVSKVLYGGMWRSDGIGKGGGEGEQGALVYTNTMRQGGGRCLNCVQTT